MKDSVFDYLVDAQIGLPDSPCTAHLETMKTDMDTFKKHAARTHHTTHVPRAEKESRAHSEAFERMVGAARINDPKLSTREGFER